MAGQQFQYDDSGNTFFYFLTSFVGLIVIPATYYLWPRDQNAGESGRWLAPLRSGPGRAARSCRPGPHAPRPGDAAGAAGPGSGPGPGPACVVRRSLAGIRAASLRAPLAGCLFVSPARPLLLLGVLSPPGSGLGWDRVGAREELAEEDQERAGTTPHHPSLPSPCFPLLPVSPLQLSVQMLGATPEPGGTSGTSK